MSVSYNEKTKDSNVCLDKIPPGVSYTSQAELKQMAKKEVSRAMLQGKLSSSRLKQVQETTFEKLKASFLVGSIWPKKSKIKIMFLDGTLKQKNWVKKVVMEKLAPICEFIEFVWDVPLNISDIRITFKIPRQAWSYIGTQCRQIARNEPTMSLGWIDDDVQYDVPIYKNTGHVVLHEFCHAMGMIHEHQNPKGNTIVWNKPVVYSELKRTNNWDEQQVNENMFKRYGDKELCEITMNKPDYKGKEIDIAGYCKGEEVNGSDYDPKSIMHYFYPSSWILSGPTEIPKNYKLSAQDKLWLAKYYGVPSKWKEETEEPAEETEKPKTEETEEPAEETEKPKTEETEKPKTEETGEKAETETSVEDTGEKAETERPVESEDVPIRRRTQFTIGEKTASSMKAAAMSSKEEKEQKEKEQKEKEQKEREQKEREQKEREQKEKEQKEKEQKEKEQKEKEQKEREQKEKRMGYMMDIEYEIFLLIVLLVISYMSIIYMTNSKKGISKLKSK